MREIIFNENNLDDLDVEQTVTRVKGLMINSRGKILLVYNNYTYQFPGGHLKDGEDIDCCIIREIREETGIDVTIDSDPFLCIKTYDNNYFGTNKKTLNVIYYYRIFTDDIPDVRKTSLDPLELSSEFNLYYVKFSNLRNFLKKSADNNMINISILKEMNCVLDVYDEIYGG